MNELITAYGDAFILDAEASNKIAEFEREIKRLKEAEDKLKEAILSEMESKNIIKLTTDTLNITYVAPTVRETLDSKALKEELPEIYDEYVKLTNVKASIRLRVI